ncbi:hypothetical protein DFJ77DRAFT_427121 [Powellomyces hirtus]|nr:hypothetical protein DFJ77DRAFT_427121 [Powellomyces hirtus]
MRTNSITLLFLVLSLLLFSQHTFATQTSLKMPELSATELTAHATEFKSLRERKGHFNGGEHDRDVDGYGGRKHKVMEALGETLGKPGTRAIQVLEAMGPPDEIAAGPGAIANGMPGPVLGDGEAGDPTAHGAGTGKPYFIIYYWRGRHDYLWFQVDGTPDEKIESYGWYAAGE